MSAAYRIPDEPTGGYSSQLIVNPFWALLGTMLAGSWLGAALFVLNAWLLRGPTWRREVGLTVLMLVGAPVILFALVVMGDQNLVPTRALRYLFLLIVTWKLVLAYWIFFLQQNSFALYEYFAGAERAQKSSSLGLVAVVLGSLARSNIVEALKDHPYLQVMAIS